MRIRSLSKPGRYADGNGLYLIVDPSLSKRWVLRTVIHGRRRDIGLGGFAVVPLSEARETASAMRRTARAGADPLVARNRAKTTVPTLEAAARRVHAERTNSWKNSKHAAQWLSSLEEYVFPALGTRRVDQIETPEILKALSEIWLKRPETARRVRQRMGVVMDWAKAAGYRTGDNPVGGVTKGLPRQPDRDEHHAAIPFSAVPTFLQQLEKQPAGEGVKLGLELLILTAARTNEVVGAKWSEIDLDNGIWTIPKARMKAGREHRVPLSRRAKHIVQNARRLATGSQYLFPGRTIDKPMSNMAFLMLLRRMNADFTVHGFRSAFRDWASERTNFPREVCEMALAHTIKSKAEAAYRRSDLLEKRRELMETWASFVTATPGELLLLRAG